MKLVCSLRWLSDGTYLFCTLMEHQAKSKSFFTVQLTDWHANTNERSLPWKSEKDPYRIWLSEVILQQTRAQQGLPYYLAFTNAYPTVQQLAEADENEVFRLWQGLGYYNRCKNMLATARIIKDQLGGIFPDNYDGLIQLKGIGPYTAAAIASFAFGQPNAVVDGNVYRVLARYFGIELPFDTSEGKKHFAALAQQLLDVNNSSAYNQAIMDLGATVCTPRKPKCSECPLSKKCIACRDNLIELLPVRSKRIEVKKRFFHYLLIHWQDYVWIRKRTGNDIWQNLHEPFLIETVTPMETEDIIQTENFKNTGLNYSTITYESKTTQRLTHQIIEARFFSLHFSKKPAMKSHAGVWMNKNELRKTAFPKTVLSFLEKKLYF